MTNKDPPDSLGRRDNRTIILPNPGGRRPESLQPAPPPVREPASPVPGPEDAHGEEWIKGHEPPPQPAARERPDIRIEDLVVPNENPIMQAAGPLLLLLGRLRVAQLRASPANLMGQVAEAITFFEREVRAAGVAPEEANLAKYILCAMADDIVQNIPTEDRHVWTQYSMLSRFFGERVGGVRFFAELDRAKMDPLNNYSLLELIYACLALGFQGVHRTSPNGAVTLQQIQRNLYEILRKVRPRLDRDLSPHWRGQDLPREVLRTRAPLWTICFAAALGLFGLFVTLRALLGGGADLAETDLKTLHGAGELKLVRHALAPPPRPPEPLPCAGWDTLAKVDGVGCKNIGHKTEITVGSLILFDSGKAVVKPEFKRIAARIAELLEKDPGAITIVGHTDSQKLSPLSPFASNWALSKARAEAVANVLRPSLSDPSRIKTDGKGDKEPIGDNRTEQGKAKNRRVVITLTRLD